MTEEAVVELERDGSFARDSGEIRVEGIEQVVEFEPIHRDARDAQDRCPALGNPSIAESRGCGKVQGTGLSDLDILRHKDAGKHFWGDFFASRMNQDFEGGEADVLGGIDNGHTAGVPSSAEQDCPHRVEGIVGRAVDAEEFDQTGNPYSRAAMMYSTARPPLSVRSKEKGVAPPSSMWGPSSQSIASASFCQVRVAKASE